MWKQEDGKFKNPVTLFPYNIFISNFVIKLDLTKIFDTWKTLSHLPYLHILQTRVTNNNISKKKAVSLTYFYETWSAKPNWQNEMITSKNSGYMTICVFYRPSFFISEDLLVGVDFKLWPLIGLDNKRKIVKCQAQSFLG